MCGKCRLAALRRISRARVSRSLLMSFLEVGGKQKTPGATLPCARLRASSRVPLGGGPAARKGGTRHTTAHRAEVRRSGTHDRVRYIRARYGRVKRKMCTPTKKFSVREGVAGRLVMVQSNVGVHERRRFARFRPFRADSACTVVGPNNFLGRATVVEIVNISADGLCVRALESLELGECICGCLCLSAKDEIHYSGRVMWVKLGGATMAGIEFLGRDPMRESRLESIRRRSAAGYRCR